MTRHLLLLAALALSAGCRSSLPLAHAPAQAPAPMAELLNAVLWTQSSVEYAATTRTIYTAAQRTLDEALADTSWTADPVQQRQQGYGRLPAAVIMDVDETILDNSPYQAWLVQQGVPYTDSTWNAWGLEAAAPIIPGADDFIRYAQQQGVRVFFVTNREPVLDAATVENLEQFGIVASDPDEDLLLTKGERPEWGGSDKEPRRAFVRARYRVLLYVGDNLGDFLSGERASLSAREALVAPYDSYWGRQWIMLPNPQYGSWEGALFDNDFSLPAEAQRAAKYRRLNTWR